MKSPPAVVCHPCLRFLNEADEFRLKCLEADEFFRKQSNELDQLEYGEVDMLDEAALNQKELSSCCLAISEIKAEPEELRFDPEFQSHFEVEKLANDPAKVRKGKSAQRYRPICGFCGKEQESEYRLKQHELIAHTPISQLSPDEVFVCDLCARIFKTKQSMRNHFIRAHTPKTEKFPCHICGKVLPHQKALYAHERVHVKAEVICQYCSKSFSRKVLLSSHIAIVHLKKRL